MGKTQNGERSYAMRFTFQFSLQDTEAMEWFEAQPHKGAYLKALILADKANREETDCPLPVLTQEARFEAEWNERFELLKEFCAEFGRLPQCKEEYRGIKLGRWLNVQQNKTVAPEHAEHTAKLKSIGALDSKWEQHYKLLKAFCNENGRLPKREEVFRDVRLGSWLDKQKKQLSFADCPEHAEKLRELGVFDSVWDRKYALVKAFHAENGRLPYYGERYEGVQIGRWLNYQSKTLSPSVHPERAEKLKRLGVSLKESAT